MSLCALAPPSLRSPCCRPHKHGVPRPPPVSGRQAAAAGGAGRGRLHLPNPCLPLPALLYSVAGALVAFQKSKDWRAFSCTSHHAGTARAKCGRAACGGRAQARAPVLQAPALQPLRAARGGVLPAHCRRPVGPRGHACRALPEGPTVLMCSRLASPPTHTRMLSPCLLSVHACCARCAEHVFVEFRVATMLESDMAHGGPCGYAAARPHRLLRPPGAQAPRTAGRRYSE